MTEELLQLRLARLQLVQDLSKTLLKFTPPFSPLTVSTTEGDHSMGKGISVRDLILFDGIRTSCTMVILFEGDQEDHFHTLIPLVA